jgi:hypothetical protein
VSLIPILDPRRTVITAPIPTGVAVSRRFPFAFLEEHYPFNSAGVQKAQDGILTFGFLHIGGA